MGRTRLVLTKYGAVMSQVAAAVVWVMAVGLIAGGIAFGFGSLPTLSGTTLSAGAAVLRIVLAGGYVVCGMAGLAALGLFISTLTTSGVGAAAAAVALAIASQIVDGLNALHAVHPYLISHGWFAFVDLFRSPVDWHGMIQGLLLDGAYAAIFLGSALVAFNRKDVVS